MSFGFSVGDFLAVAKLAYTLGKTLSDSRGAAKEYDDLISKLNVVHKVLLQVEELRAANQMATATVNALLFAANTTSVAMETFLDEHKLYEKSLKPGGSKNTINDLYRKWKWTTQMTEKIKALQSSLATMLASINCLVSLACYYNTGYDSRCSAFLTPNIYGRCNQQYKSGHSWAGLKVEAVISHNRNNFTCCPGFEEQKDPTSFFRAGQIFAAQITSDFELSNG